MTNDGRLSRLLSETSERSQPPSRAPSLKKAGTGQREPSIGNENPGGVCDQTRRRAVLHQVPFPLDLASAKHPDRIPTAS